MPRVISRTAADQVEAELVNRILRGDLSEETWLPGARTLARELGTSTNSVLRALTALRSRGLLQMRGGRPYVPSLAQMARMDLLIEMVLWNPKGPRAKKLLPDLLRFLRRALVAATEEGAARADGDPANLRLAVAELDWDEGDLTEVVIRSNFRLLSVIAFSGGYAPHATLNAFWPLFEAPRPVGPGKLVFFSKDQRWALLGAYENRQSTLASQIVDEALAEAVKRWLAPP